jgi:sorting nexin-25
VGQESIVDSLTSKAELTNNAAELRILRKSKASLQREIHRKELQRQQYIVQESDNSLYGRATVFIQSIMVGTEEDGKEYAMYVVEVKRRAGDQMPAATWVVSRRYSEFHELNKMLRELGVSAAPDGSQATKRLFAQAATGVGEVSEGGFGF